LPASDTASGSTSQAEAQEPTAGSTGISPRAGPGTAALAAAIEAACSPAVRAAPERSGAAKNPQEEPTSARTPIPASSSWARSSTSPLRAVIDSNRRCITRASAYRAPAASAAWTAASAASNSLMTGSLDLVESDIRATTGQSRQDYVSAL